MSKAGPLPPREPSPGPTPVPASSPPPPQRHRLRRFFLWTGGTIAGLMAIMAIALTVLLDSQRFHTCLLAKVNARATQSLNAQVHLGNFALHFSPLGLDVYGVVVHGASPYSNPPLLELQHAHVGIGIASLIHRKWYLTDVRLDHPVVRIFFDRNGRSNIPRPKPSNSRSTTTIWDLGIRHAVLDRGEVYYNAQAAPVSADLHDVEFRAAYDVAQTKYAGTLQYNDGRVVFAAYRPFIHNFNAAFDATPSAFDLLHARISSGATQVNLVAAATNFGAPHVQGTYDIAIDGAQMAQILRNASVPSGMVRLRGSATWQQVPNVPALETISLSGDLSSRQLVVRTPSLRAAIDGIAAHYSLAHGDAVLQDFRAGILGGEVTAHGSMKQIGGNAPHSDFSASLRNISLAQADRLAPPGTRQPVSLSGVLNADAHATWGQTLKDLAARVDSTIHGSAARRHPVSGTVATAGPPAALGPIPVDSVIHAVYTGASQQLTLANSFVRLPQTSLDLNGTVGNRSHLFIALQARDLREVAAVEEMFSTPSPGKPQTQPLDLAGAATFTGSVTGSTSNPRLTGQLAASNLRVDGTAWKVFRAGVDASSSQAQLINADLEPAPRGSIRINAHVGLRKWVFSATSPAQIDLDASDLDLASLMKFAGQGIPVTGTLNTQVTLHGSENNPVGYGSLSLTRASAYNERINSIQIKFNGTGDEAQAHLSLRLPAGAVQSSVTVWPKEQRYNAQLASTGVAIEKLATVQSWNLGAAGTVAIQASGQGTFDNPQLTASIRIPSLSVKGQQVADIRLDANVANHVADATLTSAAIHTNIQAQARVNLTGDYLTDATLDTGNIPLQPILAIFSPENSSSLSGATELHATLHGPVKKMAALEAHVTIPYLNVSWNNKIQLAAAAPIRADFQNGVLTLGKSAVKGTDTNLEFQGSVPVNSNGPMSLLLRGSVNLQLAQLFDPDVHSSGELRFNIDSHRMSAGAIGGEIDLVNVNYAAASLPVGLRNGNGVLKLTSDRVNIQTFRGTVGGGEVSASGGVQYRPSMQFDLALAARDIRMLYPEGMRENIDADIRMAGSTDNALLSGTVNLANVSFTPAFDLSSFAGQFSSGVAPPASGAMSQNIHLNLAVHSSNDVTLVSRELSVNGSANLQVRGTADNPVILGRADLTDGDIIVNGDRFVLTGATIQFVNPTETQPVVNATITTSIQQYNISMRFRGPTDHLQTQYTSDPALPEVDIIHLLAFGNTTEAAANQPATPANQMAESLVADQVSSQITSRVARVAGISQLSISPVLGNAQNNQQAGANITLQQRVTGNLFVTFSDNTAEGTQTVQGEYRVSPRVSVSATRDPNGGFAADLLIKKEY